MKPLEFKTTPVKGRCSVKYCNNKCEGKMCSTHRSQVCRENDPVKYAYNNLKSNAYRRNIPFTITLPQFRAWCKKVTYIGHAGRSPEGYTIDRRHNDVGYHIDNICVLTRTDNVKKYFHYDYRNKQTMYQVAVVNEDNEQPF